MIFAKLNPFGRIKTELTTELENALGKKDVEAFRKFAFKQSLVPTAIAFIVGSLFQKSVTAVSDNLLMPLVNYACSQTGANWRAWTYTPFPGLTFGVGPFLGSLLDFIIAAGLLYLVYVKLWAPIFDDKPTKIICVENKECAYCASMIYYKAKRCPNCTTWQK